MGGGASTNLYGKLFELRTCMKPRLKHYGFNEINKYCFTKLYHDKIITYLTQSYFKKYMFSTYGIKVHRHPDEAYIIQDLSNNIKTLKVLEKKEQKCEGSVDVKLWAAPSLKREYELTLGHQFNVEYSLCINDYLTHKFNTQMKYKILSKILKENGIHVFHFDEHYYNNIEKWIGITI